MVTDGGEEVKESSKSKCKENKFDCIFKYYEKAIEGRNFHYQNYNTWANYYSIFTGALFVGFYTIEQNSFLQFLIILVGLVTSICWNLTVKGHYHWMLSWINVVQDYEKELAGIYKKNQEKEFYVYSVYKNKGENFLHKNISSQKITSKFTFFISIAWAILLAKTFYDFFNRFQFIKCSCVFSLIFSIVATTVIYILCYLIFDKPSETSKMKDSIHGNEE